MSELWAFEPVYINTGLAGSPAGSLLGSVTLAATASSQAVVIPRHPGNQIQIANQAAAWAYVNFGIAGSVVAATAAASYPVAPGAVVVVTVATEVSGATVILATGTGNVTFTCGAGL